MHMWWLKIQKGGSGQDEGVGRNTLHPCITKRRITNLKTKNNQNCQNIKLYGTPTTKELKKYSLRLVGGVEIGSRAERTHGKEADCSGRVGNG